jgi:hypothetical protein
MQLALETNSESGEDIMATVIPKQPKKERDQITIRLDHDVLETLEHYCRYLQSSRDWVINQCLTFIFRKDKAFTMWLAGQGIASSPTISGAAAKTARIANPKGKNGALQGRLSIGE